MKAIQIDNIYPNFIKLDMEELYLRHNGTDIVFTYEGLIVAEWKDNLRFKKNVPHKVKKFLSEFYANLLAGNINLI